MSTPLQELAVIEERGQRSLPVPPGYAAAQPAAWDIEPEEQTLPLSHYLWVLRCHRWKILSFVGISAIATLIVSARLTPVYESTVTVDVDRKVPTAVVGQEATQSVLNDADQFLATQIKLIQSDAVLRPVADQYHLRDLEQAAAKGTDQGLLIDAPVMLKNLKVTRPANTYLLLIGYRSPDRRLAADVANATARSWNTTSMLRIASATVSGGAVHHVQSPKPNAEEWRCVVDLGNQRSMDRLLPTEAARVRGIPRRGGESTITRS